jgi:Flp pilus assembly protein TadD
MRFRRAWHAALACAVITGVAGAQKPPKKPVAAPKPAEPPKLPEPTEIPEYAAGPKKLAVTPFENHIANGKNEAWIVAEAPFELAEKSEDVLGFEALGGPLYVPADQIPADADTVAAYGTKLGADWVVTGWFDRVGTDLRITAIAWKIERGVATKAGEGQKAGDGVKDYHAILGDVIAQMWTKAGQSVDLARADRLARALAKDTYSVALMGRGLGMFSGALGSVDLKAAEKDLEKAVFVDPKLYEAQRLLGELIIAIAPTDARAAAKAAAKFNYASDLAPNDVASLRAAAFATAAAGKHELAFEQFRRLVARRPWDLEARYQLGAALWQLGDATGAQKQLEQVTEHAPDHLAARRVLALVHASRADTLKLVAELEAIQQRAPDDLEVRGDLATTYGALGRWQEAIAQLAVLADARPGDVSLAVRIGDGHKKLGHLDRAIAWYLHAQQLAPHSSLPGFAMAQAMYDAGKLDAARATYTLLQRFVADQSAAYEALGAIALEQNHADDAAWYLRKAVREAPRNLQTRRAVIAAEIARKDHVAALAQLDPALQEWPRDAELHYLAGVARAHAGETAAARVELAKALELSPRLGAAATALAALDAGGAVALVWKPELVRPWGDGEALQDAIDRYAVIASAMAIVRSEYQAHVLALLGTVGLGPYAKVKPYTTKSCPVDQLWRSWMVAQQVYYRYARLGVELEATYRFAMRHDAIGMTQALLPNGRIAIAAMRRGFASKLADVGELRAEWRFGVEQELRVVGCTDRLLAAAAADPSRYRVIEEDKPDAPPARQAPRPKPRATFFVDNTRCPDPVEVLVDGVPLGQVAPGRRSALVADGGDRTLCLIGPGGAQCGDRGTVRRVYLHDGWSVTMQCPR